jgi:hypothetical protein
MSDLMVVIRIVKLLTLYGISQQWLIFVLYQPDEKVCRNAPWLDSPERRQAGYLSFPQWLFKVIP